jgi:hypothetical protein
MFRHSKQAAEAKAKLDTLGKSQAVIEFELDGTIITTNENLPRCVSMCSPPRRPLRSKAR